MRLPRHDTFKSLPAEHPREALARDEAMLDVALRASAEVLGDQLPTSSDVLDAVVQTAWPMVRWWVPASPAVVLGLGLHHRLTSIVDTERCRAAGVDVLERRAGGGALLLDQYVLCGAVCLPRARVADDITESYRWLGEELCERVREIGVSAACRVEVGEARADVADLKTRDDTISRLLLETCYGALSPHEVAVDGAKLVGIAQVRRRHAALFQFGILLRDQSPLSDYLVVATVKIREALRESLRRRTVGLESLLLRTDHDSIVQPGP